MRNAITRLQMHEKVMQMFRASDAIQYGHWILNSGKLTDIYFNKSKVFMDPINVNRIAHMIVCVAKDRFGEHYRPNYVISPATGAIALGYEVADQIGYQVKFAYTEEVDGVQKLKRFNVPDDSKVLIVEDIVTTGKAVSEVIDALPNGSVDGVICVVDRSENVNFNVPFESLCKVEQKTWDHDSIPAHVKAEPVKPNAVN